MSGGVMHYVPFPDYLCSKQVGALVSYVTKSDLSDDELFFC